MLNVKVDNYAHYHSQFVYSLNYLSPLLKYICCSGEVHYFIQKVREGVTCEYFIHKLHIHK